MNAIQLDLLKTTFQLYVLFVNCNHQIYSLEIQFELL